MLERMFAPSRLYERALTREAVSQRVIANNISNVNTPGFKRQEVSFPEALERADRALSIKTTRVGHLVPADRSDDTPFIRTSWAEPIRADGNNVDVDSQMARLTEVELRYSAIVQFAAGMFRSLDSAIGLTSR